MVVITCCNLLWPVVFVEHYIVHLIMCMHTKKFKCMGTCCDLHCVVVVVVVVFFIRSGYKTSTPQCR